MKLSPIENVMIDGMARAFFVSAWADRQEERGKTAGWSGNDLMDLAPKTPRYARDFALMFAGSLSGSLPVILNNAAWADVTEGLTLAEPFYRFEHPELEAKARDLQTDEYARDLGHYLAMQGLGSGVSWFDNHAKFEIKIPYTEVSL